MERVQPKVEDVNGMKKITTYDKDKIDNITSDNNTFRTIYLGNVSRGIPTEQRLEVNPSGMSNAITTVAKDSYVLEIIPYDDYNSRIPKDITAIGSITTTIGHSALRNGWKIIEVKTEKANS